MVFGADSLPSTVTYAVGITRRGACISFLSLFAGRSARSTQAKADG